MMKSWCPARTPCTVVRRGGFEEQPTRAASWSGSDGEASGAEAVASRWRNTLRCDASRGGLRHRHASADLSPECIIATNVAPRELLWRSNRWTRFRGCPLPLSDCVARMQRRSELMHRASHPWPIFYSADKQSLLAIFTGEPIPKPI